VKARACPPNVPPTRHRLSCVSQPPAWWKGRVALLLVALIGMLAFSSIVQSQTKEKAKDVAKDLANAVTKDAAKESAKNDAPSATSAAPVTRTPGISASDRDSPQPGELPPASSTGDGRATPSPKPPTPGAMPSTTPELPSQGTLASTIEPRDFGYTLGDTFEQRVSLPPGLRLAAAGNEGLRHARINTWFERLNTRERDDAQGRRWLVFTHQVTNVGTRPARVTLPTTPLLMQDGTHWSLLPAALTIGPMMADAGLGPGASAELTLRPDRDPPVPDRVQARQRSLSSLGALATGLLTWGLWWRWRTARDAARRPFARAWRVVDDAPADDKAWVALHRAFNETAGRTVLAAELEPVFARQPALQAQRAAIEAFFSASSARFFQATSAVQDGARGAGAGGSSTGVPIDLQTLARELRAIERRTRA
jgi:mxaA protein